MRVLNKKKTIEIEGKIIGGKDPIIIAGPCAVESQEQILDIAKGLKERGAHFLRGGIFKPRTSPYDFQGLGIKGLEYMVEAKKVTGLSIVTELMDLEHLDAFVEYVDVIQVGSRNMYNYSLLQALGKTQKPILLKRGFTATVKEWIYAAEHIAQGGNHNIIFCERGVRTFETYTRNMLDLTVVPIMQKETGLPVIVDPSHGTGIRDLVPIMSKGAIAVGADGLLIEAHTHPEKSISDKDQTVSLDVVGEIIQSIKLNV